MSDLVEKQDCCFCHAKAQISSVKIGILCKLKVVQLRLVFHANLRMIVFFIKTNSLFVSLWQNVLVNHFSLKLGMIGTYMSDDFYWHKTSHCLFTFFTDISVKDILQVQ